MSTNVVSLTIPLDIKGARLEIDKLTDSINGVGDAIRSTGSALVQSMDFAKEVANFQVLATCITSAVNEMRNLSAILVEQSSLQWPEMIDVISNVCTIFQTLISVTEANTIAQLNNIAAAVNEYISAGAEQIKTVADTIARISASTAAWIANTSATVASTAAEWAQIAATTAWNAICTAATAVTTAFGAAMAFVTSPIGLVVTAIAALIAIVVLLIANWDSVKAAALSVWETIKAAFGTAAGWFNANVVQPVAGFFAGLWNGIQQAAVSAWEGIKRVFSTVATFFGDIFSKAWAGVVNVFSAAGNVFNNIKDGVLSVFKSVVNGLIDGINAVVAIPFRGINSALSFVRSVEIVGIKPFSGLRTLSIPQIPHLARGAVLPANKPFLAVVGDQRHGTNVEAPLTTIQEAVRVEVGEMMAVMATSLDALLRENRELRRTVEHIRIGDEVIGQAARRYEHRMAIIGGSL